jgi:hypothetical protein
MMQHPLDLTQSDLAGLMEAGQTLANVPGVGAGSSPMGGFGELLNNAERGMNLLDRFSHFLNDSGNMIMRLRSAEGLGIDQPVQGSFFPAGSGQVIDGDVYRPPQQTITTPSPESIPPLEPEPVPAIQPVQIYSKLLGELAKLPGNMTVTEALQMARDNKTLILGAIEKELPNLLGAADGPGE